MPGYRRVWVEGGSYFFTVVTERRRELFLREDVRAALRLAVAKVRERYPFEIEAWVLLPDHIHCIWTLPREDADYATRWRLIKTHTTKQLNLTFNDQKILNGRRIKKRQGGIWQHRYWEHYLKDEDDYNHHVDYVHWNPVKHNLVTHPSQWPYSTYHRWLKNVGRVRRKP